MKEEASVRNLGRLKSLIRLADGLAGMNSPRAQEVVNRHVRILFRGHGATRALTTKTPAPTGRVPSARPFQAAFGLDEADNPVQPLALLQVGHDEGTLAAHAPCVGLHLLQGGAHMGRKVGLVDDQQVGPGDARAALAFSPRRAIWSIRTG